MHSLLSPYLGQLTCGIDIDLSPCNVEDAVKSMLATSSERPDIDNMEVTPLHISIEDLRQTNKKVYIEFKLTENEVTLTKPRISTPTRSVFDVLMSHETHLPSLKLDAKTGNARKYNAVAGYVKSQKFGVPATMLIMKNSLPVFVLFRGTSTLIIINSSLDSAVFPMLWSKHF